MAAAHSRHVMAAYRGTRLRARKAAYALNTRCPRDAAHALHLLPPRTAPLLRRQRALPQRPYCFENLASTLPRL